MKKVISFLFGIAGGFFFLKSVVVGFEVVRK